MDDTTNALSEGRRWRVLQIISSSVISGAEKQFVLLCKTLQARGHIVKAVCPPKGWLPHALSQQAIETTLLPLRGSRYLPNLWYLLKLLRRERIDLIHTHLTRGSYYGLLLHTFSGIPVVATAHILNSDPVYRWLARRGNYIIAVSEAVRQWLIEHGVPSERIFTVYNATELADSQVDVSASNDSVRAELGLPSSSKIIALFGTINATKGHDLIVQALPAVLESHPEVHVLSVGRIDKDFIQQLEHIAVQLEVRQHITFLGERYDVPRLMQAADIVTLPSRKEAFGLAILEAMALAKPVVVSKSGGLVELVQHRSNGLVVNGSPHELARALIELLDNAELRYQLGQAARLTVCRHYTPRLMVDRVEKIYHRMVSPRDGSDSPLP